MKRYKRPPIKEAICEIRFAPGAQPWDLAVPGLLFDRVRRSFGKRRQARNIEIGIDLSKTLAQQQIIESERLQFLSDDEKQILTVGTNLLSVSRVEPYTSWEEFLPIIQEVLKSYLEITNPAGLQRVGLRYVNMIGFSETTIRLEDYFEFYPFIGKNMPQDLSSIMVAVLMPFENNRDVLRTQLATLPPAPPSALLRFSLDLDYFLGKAEAIPLTQIEQWLGTAHAHVESVFEACIRQRLRDRFVEVEAS